MAVENNMDDELDQVSAEAMQIIMSAGDARVSCNDALKAIAEGNVESARELIKKAEGQIAEAHHVQTDAIQGSIGGETQAYSLLFAHAQDTLMLSLIHICPCARHALRRRGRNRRSPDRSHVLWRRARTALSHPV